MPTPNFVGRADELQKLSTAVHAGKIGVVAAVHGVGGMGKTELAVNFADNEAARFAGGLWLLNAEGHKELLPLLGDLTLELDLTASTGAGETPEHQGRRVLADLKRRAQEGHGSCLLILDNVSEPQLLASPQLSTLPHEEWFRMIVTTRLGKHELHGKGLAFIPVDSLLEEDAMALVREHQPDGAWPAATATADEAAVRELVRELGCFTLAVEAVAIYLGQHPEIRPSAYLARLRREGLPSADELGQHPDVAAQMQHREKQLALVLDVTLEKLAPAELAALEFASLLVPDTIPWPWLRILVDPDHGEALRSEEGYPDPWIELRRRLESMRLLTPGDHPEIARLHRLIASHLLTRAGGRTHTLRDRVDDFLDTFCGYFEKTWVHDPSILWLLKPLQDTVLHLAQTASDLRLAENASILAVVEMEMGRLKLAFTFLELAEQIFEKGLEDNQDSEQARRGQFNSSIHIADFLVVRGQEGDAEEALGHYRRGLEVSELLHRDNPESAQAARDVSLGLERLGDFLVRRGQAGDAEEALSHYRRSLEVRERLHRDNSESAQAARDVSVSLNKLGHSLASRGQVGDAEEALGHYRRSLEVREGLYRDNRDSAQAARDVSVSLSKLADFLASRGQAGDAEEALGHYRRSLEVDERLHQDNPDSAQAARDVSVSLAKLGDFLANCGQAGGAEEALTHYRRSLEVCERLHRDNPDSAQAARDVLVSLQLLAKALGGQDREEFRNKALEYQMRSLEIALALRQANPLSFFYERTAAVSYIMTSQRAQAAGDQELADQCLADCHAVLHGMVTAGVMLDPPMMDLYDQLHSALTTDDAS